MLDSMRCIFLEITILFSQKTNCTRKEPQIKEIENIWVEKKKILLTKLKIWKQNSILILFRMQLHFARHLSTVNLSLQSPFSLPSALAYSEVSVTYTIWKNQALILYYALFFLGSFKFWMSRRSIFFLFDCGVSWTPEMILNNKIMSLDIHKLKAKKPHEKVIIWE